MRHDKIIQALKEVNLLAGLLSKDQSTQAGAVFVDPDGYTPLTTGYNGIPRGVEDTDPARHERPLKYSYFEHAERNAIYNLARERLVNSIAITTSLPHLSCIRALVSVGTAELWLPIGAWDQLNDLDSVVAQTLLQEAGVQVYWFDRLTEGYRSSFPLLDAESERHWRKLQGFLTYAQELPSLYSKDPTPDATVFLRKQDYSRLTWGYSGLPRGAMDHEQARYLGALRDQWVEGSVRNAVYNLVRPLLKNSLALVNATTCVECARAIAAVGAGRVCYLEPSEGFKLRWGPSIKTALSMLDELGVAHTEVPRGAVVSKTEQG